jgi:hypothetical protein
MPSQGGSAGSNPVGATSLAVPLTSWDAGPDASPVYAFQPSRAHQRRTSSRIEQVVEPIHRRVGVILEQSARSASA